MQLKLDTQEIEFHEKIHSQMVLLDYKKKEQDLNIHEIKVSMQQLNKTYQDKAEELEQKKKIINRLKDKNRNLLNELEETKDNLLGAKDSI